MATTKAMSTTQKKTNEMAVINDFAIVDIYTGMTEEDAAELKDQLEDFSEEQGLNYKVIKVPSGGQLAFAIPGDEEDDEDYEKEFEGVIIFTHRMNGFWPNPMGSSEDKAPQCSSMDGKTGVDRYSGEVRNCETCPFNTFGSDSRGKGKACKNMRRLYLIRSSDPNLYMLSVPPTSIRDVNRQLTKIMGSKGIPYTKLLIALKLQKAQNADGIAYSKVVLEKRGILPQAVADQIVAMRNEIKQQYQQNAITADDYAADSTVPHDDAPLPDEPPAFTDIPPEGVPPVFTEVTQESLPIK